MPLSTKEARALATMVAKTSNGVSVKFGCTNGKNVLHLNGPRRSFTISEEWEWAEHDWNKLAIGGNNAA